MHVTPIQDLEAANRELFALREQLAAKEAEIEARAKELEEKASRIAELTEQIEYLRRQLFGRRRESIDPNQLQLFDSLQSELHELKGEASPAKKDKKAKCGHGRAPLSPDLPRET
ncbi:MAG: hypothetical protein AAFU50_12205, partial [Pseudomonadota bacterium]